MTHSRLFKASALAMAIGGIVACSSDDGDNGSNGEDASRSTISLSFLGRFSSGSFDESAAEIVAFDPASEQAYVVNAEDGTIQILDLSDPTTPADVATLDLGTDIATALVSVAAATDVGAANSVSAFGGNIAVAVEADNKQANGWVAFYQADGTFISAVEVGALPDMLTFTPDGTKVVVANEGEPSDDYATDPEGSVSIIDVSGGLASISDTNVTTVSFTDFNTGNARAAELSSDVRIFGPGATVAQDLEPEYVTISDDSATAWVALQENNAIAEINLTTGAITSIWPLGFKNYGIIGNELDASNRDNAINIRNWPVFGMYQPDSIASYSYNGTTYLVTANEGDAREYDTFSEEFRVGDIGDDFAGTLTLDDEALFSFSGAINDDENLGRLRFTSTLGFDPAEVGCTLGADGEPDSCTFTEIYSYGARSFSIWDTTTGDQVFDSGSDFERITAARLGDVGFNASNDDNDDFDGRSDDKGPEPEALTLGVIDGSTYAFIGLERVGGIMVYDISQPEAPSFVQYITTRNFTEDADAANAAGGDLGPEGMAFVDADDSPNGEYLLIVGNEVSGTTAIYQIDTVEFSE